MPRTLCSVWFGFMAYQPLVIMWLTESEQTTPVDLIKDVVGCSMKVPEFDNHLKTAGVHIDRNVKITIKMKTIVRKPLMIKYQPLFVI